MFDKAYGLLRALFPPPQRRREDLSHLSHSLFKDSKLIGHWALPSLIVRKSSNETER
jgi:hypothetical protein